MIRGVLCREGLSYTYRKRCSVRSWGRIILWREMARWRQSRGRRVSVVVSSCASVEQDRVVVVVVAKTESHEERLT